MSMLARQRIIKITVLLLVLLLVTSYYLGVVTFIGETARPYHIATHKTSPHRKKVVGYDIHWVEYKSSRGLQSASLSLDSSIVEKLVPNSRVNPLHLDLQPQVDKSAVNDTQTVKLLPPTGGSVFQRTSELMKTPSSEPVVGLDPPVLKSSDNLPVHSFRKKLISDNNPIQSVTLATPNGEASHRRYTAPCFGDFCAGSLEPADQQRMFSCLRQALDYLHAMGFSHKSALAQMRCSCRLMDDEGPKRIGLVSLPGSGNTWVRGLLEKATGICTGSMWCDRTLRSMHFCGESLRGTSLLVVKNHDASLRWRRDDTHDSEESRKKQKPPYDAVIFLHRDPFDAIVAEWNRAAFAKYQNTSAGSNMHTAHYGPDMFGVNPEWNEMVLKQTGKWKLMMKNYVVNHGDHPVLVVRFEDLKRDAFTEMKRMLDFIQFPYSDHTLEQRVQDGYTHFHRNHTDLFEHYTVQQRELLNSAIRDIIRQLHMNGTADIIGLHQYLRS